MSEFGPNDIRALGISLPPAPILAPLSWGAAAASTGCAAWYWAITQTGYHFGIIACGIGALVGFAITLGGGYGRLHTAFAAVFVFLAIGTGVQRYYEITVSTAATDAVHDSRPGKSVWMKVRRDARRWVDLGGDPTPTQIRSFATRHGYACESPAMFARTVGPRLREFAEARPTYEQWLANGPEVPRPEIQAASSRSAAGFVEFVLTAFHPLDLLAWLAGIGVACGIIRRATITKLFEERERLLQTSRPSA